MFHGRPVDARKVLRHMMRSGKSNKRIARLRGPPCASRSDTPVVIELLPPSSDASNYDTIPECEAAKDRPTFVYATASHLNDIEVVRSFADPWLQQALKGLADTEDLDVVLSHVHAYFETTSFASVLKPVDQLDYRYDPTDRSRDPNGQFFDTIKLAV